MYGFAHYLPKAPLLTPHLHSCVCVFFFPSPCADVLPGEHHLSPQVPEGVSPDLLETWAAGPRALGRVWRTRKSLAHAARAPERRRRALLFLTLRSPRLPVLCGLPARRASAGDQGSSWGRPPTTKSPCLRALVWPQQAACVSSRIPSCVLFFSAQRQSVCCFSPPWVSISSSCVPSNPA